MKYISVFASIIISAALNLVNTAEAAPTSIETRGDAASSNKVMIGYFPNWLYTTYLPSEIDFSAYTHIYYAFALEVESSTPVWADDSIFDAENEYSFQTLVKLANAAGTKVLVSIGGWTGGTQFSPMIASAAARTEFIKWNTDFISKYNTDGVDIDWEYPTDAGPGCNVNSPADVDNFLILVKELRASLDNLFPNDYKELTMAVYVTPWSREEEVEDVSAFVPYVDRFLVMTYEINNAANTTSGPNAPFRAQPGFGFSKGFVEGIKSWKSAGVPYSKIVAGIPFYGHARTLTVDATPTIQYNPASPTLPLGDSDDGPWTNPYCPLDSTPASGVWKWKNLRSQGVLASPTTAASPWIRNFDKITKTPWLYNPINKQYISYDDPVSVSIKTQWAITQDLAGLFCWSVDQDNGELLEVMKPILDGNTPPPSSK